MHEGERQYNIIQVNSKIMKLQRMKVTNLCKEHWIMQKDTRVLFSNHNKLTETFLL